MGHFGVLGRGRSDWAYDAFAKDKVVSGDISRSDTRIKPLSAYSKFVIALSLFVILSNAVQALISAGIPPYSGKGDPERISLNNTWTSDVWKRFEKPFSFVGANVVEDAFIAGEPNDIGVKFNSRFLLKQKGFLAKA